MTLAVNQTRLDDRRALLAGLDRMNAQVDRSGAMDGVSRFEQQAFNLVLGGAPEAFNLKREKPKLVARYGKGLGEQLLLARRLCQAGCGFVTVSYAGWDMHQQIASAMEKRAPQLDHAVATFIEDVKQQGLADDILLVITGEFGRTPRVNGGAGRDHWAPLSTLALAGGGLRMGQTVGESNARAEVPRTTPITPQDLMATIFHVLGMPQGLHYNDPTGRPVPMINGGRPIRELVG
jgi:uncharacterized protein (DUF1501 family)